MYKYSVAISTILAFVASAQEKGTFIIDVIGGPVSPAHPVVEVRLYASFPQQYWAFGSTTLHISSSDPTGQFFNMTKPIGPGALSPSGACAMWAGGTPNSSGGVGPLGASQFNAVGCAAGTWNPILIWQAEWTTSDFAARNVVLATDNILKYSVYVSSQSSLPDLFLNYEPAAAVFQVIPTPGSIACIGAIVVASRRRRF